MLWICYIYIYICEVNSDGYAILKIINLFIYNCLNYLYEVKKNVYGQ